jgi:histone-lysine N-methyltransferase SETMAR
MAVQAVPNSVAQRIIIKFLTKEGVIPSEIFTRLQTQFGHECLSQPRVFSWAKSFREVRDCVENEPHVRRPRTSVNPDNVLKIGELIRANRRITVFELSQEVGISVGSVEEILHNELKVSKVSARWVPWLLSPEHRERHLVAVTQRSQRYEREGAEFLDSVVTCDETWVHYFTPKSKRASKQCEHPFSTPQKSESNFFSGEDHVCCVLGFKGYQSPGLSHWSKNHQCSVLFNSPE